MRNRDAATISQVTNLFRGRAGIAEVLAGDDRKKYSLDHERAGRRGVDFDTEKLAGVLLLAR